MRLFLFGNGGFAREVWAYITQFPEELFLDGKRRDPPDSIFFVGEATGEELPANVALISEKQYSEIIEGADNAATFLASGNCEVKKAMLRTARPPFAGYIHRSAFVARPVDIGAGCLIAPLAVVAPFVKLESHVLVNYGATVGHHTEVGNYSVVSPNSAVGGRCKIGEFTYVGAGAMIHEELSIGSRVMIGMGAIVTKDVPDNSVVVGINQVCTREGN